MEEKQKLAKNRVPVANYGKGETFGSKLHAYWYRFRVFTDRHTMKMLYLWGATTLTILGLRHYQDMNGKSSASDEEADLVAEESEPNETASMSELKPGDSAIKSEFKAADGESESITPPDLVVKQSELEQKIHDWIVKLGLNKTTHDSNRPK